MSGWENLYFWLRFLSTAPEEDGWVTCQDDDPFSGLSNYWKSEVDKYIFVLLDFLPQLAIPSHLLHETQCIEGCRTDSGYDEEGYSIFDKQDKKCFCVAKSNTWGALTDPTAAIPTPITQQDCYKFRYKVYIFS